MGSMFEQADGTSKIGASFRRSSYHRWLKRARPRAIRRWVKLLLRKGEDPPKRVGFRGYET